MIGAWDGIDEFVAVAETGSFTSGARVFGSSVTHMSRSIARLEARLQAQLLHRTTRTVRLTDTGRLFLDHCRRMVLDRDEALGMVSTRAEPQGELRCTCSTTLGERFLMPILLRYGALYPQVQLHVELTNRIVDLVAEGYDLALRTGAFDDGRLLRVPIAERAIHSCASPAYLDRVGWPGTIADLKVHRCLVGSASGWHFRVDGREHLFRPQPGWRCNSGVSVADAALAGMGICQLPEFYVAEHLKSGRLVSVLDEFRPDPEPIWAVYPQRRHVPPKVSRLVDMLSAELPLAIQATA